MAWQKNKVLLISVDEITEKDGSKKKVVVRRAVRKSKGGKTRQLGKLELKKYNPILNKHTLHKEVKFK